MSAWTYSESWQNGWDEATEAAGKVFTEELQKVIAERDALQKSVNDYAANLGDIVTYGTTADVLDQKLKQTIAERDALQAQSNRMSEHLDQIRSILESTDYGSRLNRLRDIAKIVSYFDLPDRK